MRPSRKGLGNKSTEATYAQKHFRPGNEQLKISSISIRTILFSARNLGFILNSKLYTKTHVIKICQTAYFEIKRIRSISRFLTEDGAAKTLVLLLPISSHGLTTATVSSWVHLILSSNRFRKFRTLLQDLFSWHHVAANQHLSWKNCTGFPFQNILSIKSLDVFQCY